MEYVYAALLLHSAGKDVTEEGIKNVVAASGVAADDVRIKALVAALEGVDISKVLSQPRRPALLLPLQLHPQPKRKQKRAKRLQRRAE